MNKNEIKKLISDARQFADEEFARMKTLLIGSNEFIESMSKVSRYEKMIVMYEGMLTA